jgi:hypothetical protein
MLFCILFGIQFTASAQKPLLTSSLSQSFLLKKQYNSEPIFKADSPTCVLSFSRAGNLILVKAKADTTEGNFILDTGAPGLVLNLTYFRNYATTFHADEEQSSMVSNTGAVSKTTIKELVLGSFHYFKVEADMVNLAHIKNKKGVKILGLLGMQMFKDCEMIFDYDKNLIYLHHISKKEAATYKHEMLNDTSAYSTFPIELNNNKIIVKSEMAGKKLRLIIDCGAESNILDSRLPNKIFEQVTINQRVMLTGAGKEKVEALYGDLQNLKIGGRLIEPIPVIITNLEKTCFSFEGCVDGVLGFDFLSLHKTGFNLLQTKCTYGSN